MSQVRSFLESAPLAAARAALDGLTRRQEAISSNVANVDTVGYRRKSVTFERALRDQIAASHGEHPLATTNASHIPSASMAGRDLNGIENRDVVASRNDDNRVSIDEEMSLLADTQLRYQALTQSINGRLGTLRNIIRGGR
ncbi:MAG: flagellar basal body rod protein FlgB [Dehalococcoidia bacterium]